jgi:hypothetical protein
MRMSCFSAISAGEKHALCFAEASAVPTQDTCAIIQEDGLLVQGLSMHMTRINLIARKPERPSVRPYALQDIKERQFG